MRINHIRFCFALLGVLWLNALRPACAQYFEPANNRKSSQIRFKMARNLIIVPLKINDRGPFNFIMDTGVGTMIITDPAMIDSANLKIKRTIMLAGLDGKDAYEARLTSALKIDIAGFDCYGVGAAVFTKDHFGLSNYAGIPIHGLLGYEFFNRMAVKINFSDSTITAYRPEKLRGLKKYIELPLQINGNKPYITTQVHFADGTVNNCKLITDLGSGQALILNSMRTRNWPVKQTIPANLGVGLTGIIEGKMGRVSGIQLGKYHLQSVLSCFPDVALNDTLADQADGNVGINILKKFTVIFDYSNQKIYLKPRYCFKEPFEHDMSGLEYYADGNNLKHIIISRVEPGSPAEQASLNTGDELTAINFKPVASMSIEEIDDLFRSKDGRNLILEVYNNKKYDSVILTLKRRI